MASDLHYPGVNVEEAASVVAQFYAGKSVFITGGTGFLGKVFLEKLLYSCSDIDKVFLLVRDKMGVQANERLEELFEKPLFSRIKQDKPEVFQKVVPVSGDLTAPNLGIKPEDEQIIFDNVSVFIHSAATIKFNEVLSIALEVNVDGTKNALSFAQRMKNMEVFVYVSTAYIHPEESVLEETAYAPPVDLEQAYEYAKYLHANGENEAELIKFLRGHPNTYTFTKVLAEHYVIENRKNIPVIIIRPSIVSASYNEPVPGWVDNWCGASAIIVGIIKGLVRVLYARPEVVLDLIPLDYVANLIIVATAKRERSEGVSIYNCCSSWANPITIGEVINNVIGYASKQGMHTYPTIYFTMQYWILKSLQILLQTCPAYLIDIWLKITGKEARFVKTQTKFRTVCKLLEFFTTNTWEMKCEKTRKLYAFLSDVEQKTFNCDPKNINWEEYMTKYVDGIVKFLLKEKL